MENGTPSEAWVLCSWILFLLQMNSRQLRVYLDVVQVGQYTPGEQILVWALNDIPHVNPLNQAQTLLTLLGWGREPRKVF